MKKKRSNPKARDSRSAYINRRSQITKKSPRRRLKKRRAVNFDRPKKGRFPNPGSGTRRNSRPLLFILTAKKGAGKKMHFDGTNFSERARVSTFPTMEKAQTKGLELLRKYSHALRGYRLKVEPNF
jgi:hypothetical protein